MEESYETFEEELGPPGANPPPQKPVRQIRRPEMYVTRKIREQEMVPATQESRVEPKALPKETTFHATSSNLQNLKQMETPWENVTLNRCLLVAITILVLTSGFQRLHETLRGQGSAEEEEEVGLKVRWSGTLRHREKVPKQPETSLWEVMFWWLPDLDDDDEDEDDNGEKQVKRRRLIKRATARGSSGLRNKPVLDKSIMKQKDRKLKDKRTKKTGDEETKGKRERARMMELHKAADEEEANEGEDHTKSEEVQQKGKKLVKKNKDTHTG